MTLSGGLGARTWNKKPHPGGKHWPPDKSIIRYNLNLIFSELLEEDRLDIWLTGCKHYVAEYYDSD